MSAKPVDRPSAPDWDANAHYQDLRVATDYDAQRFTSLAGRVFNDLERRLIVRAFAAIRAGGRIADVPCGTGRLAEPCSPPDIGCTAWTSHNRCSMWLHGDSRDLATLSPLKLQTQRSFCRSQLRSTESCVHAC